jgi:hypothetical protein
MQFSLTQSMLAGSATISVVLAGTIAATLLRDKRRQDLRIFLAYCISYIAIIILIWSAYFYAGNPSSQYSRVFWAVSVVHMALEFGVMYEIFRNALRPYSALVDLGKMLFSWASVFLLVTAALTAIATSGPSATKFAAAFAVVERSMRLMECGLLMLFFFFEKRLGLSWRNLNVSIALGLGTTASVDLILSYIKTRFPTTAMITACDVVDGAVFMGILVGWFYCLALRKSEPLAETAPSRLVLQRWNETLASAAYSNSTATVGSRSVESFIPGIERTVERVLARKLTN